MDNYINKIFFYCFYCIRTKNLYYDLYDDKKNYINSVDNYMYRNEKNELDDDFVIIEKSK